MQLKSPSALLIDGLYLPFDRWNDKKAKMHYILFCMPEISPTKLYFLRKATDPNRYVRRLCGCVHECVFKYVPLTLRNCACAGTTPAASCPSTSATTSTALRKTTLQLSWCLISFLEILCWAVILNQWLDSKFLFSPTKDYLLVPLPGCSFLWRWNANRGLGKIRGGGQKPRPGSDSSCFCSQLCDWVQLGA